MDITDNSGIQDPLLQSPQAVAYEGHPYQKPCRGPTNGLGNCKSVSKRSSAGSAITGRPVHFNPVSGTKRKWRGSPSYQSSGAKSIPRKGVLQNGRTTGCEVPTTERRLYDETGPEGCILCNPHSLISQEVSAVCVSGQSLRVSVPPIWPLLCSPSLHKNSETNVSSAPFTRNSDCNLHRRHATSSSKEPGVAEPVCAGGSLPGKSGLPGQGGEMLSCSIPVSCLSRGPVGLDNNDTFSPSAKAKQYFGGLSTPPRTELCPGKDSGHTDWTFEPCLSNRDHACPSSLQSSPALALTSCDSVWPWEQSVNPLDHASPGRPGVVGLGEPTPEWLSNSAAPYRCYHLDRCVQEGLGCSIPGEIYWRSLVRGGGNSTHQCPGITSSNLSLKSPVVGSTASAQTCPLAVRQHDSGGVHQQAGGPTLPCPDHSGTATLGSSPGSRSVPDSSAYSRDSEWSSRHCLQTDRKQNRVDSGQRDLPISLSEVLHTGRGPLCISPNSSSAKVCLEVPGSRSCSRGRISPGLEQMDLSNPPFSGPSPSNPQEDKRRSGNSSPDCTQLVWATMVPRTASNAGGSTSTPTPVSISAVPSISAHRAPPSVAVTASSSLALIRNHYETTGLSKEVVDILLASRGAATQKRYAGPWKAWVRWCSQRSICPISAPVAEVLAFLASLVTQGNLAYRTVALYKSAISQTHDPVGSTELGRLPIVSRFMKGVFKSKPPKPKYAGTWNVQTALSFLESLEPLGDLTLKQLSYKTVLLLALTSAARAHELSSLDLTYSLKKEGSWEFTLPTHTKTSRPGHPARKIFLPSFPGNLKICVVRSLTAYVEKTKKLRTSSKLFVSYISPYKAISSQSVSRWLSKALRLAGIELGYTGHSTRGASTSAAAAAGLSVELILEAADWASAQTFERFYHREHSSGSFSRAVLNS